MTVTPASIRALFPEFGSTSTYPDEAMAPWIVIGAQFVNEARWSTLTDFGITLFVCHRLVLGTMAAAQAARNQAPGKTTGIVSSKSVDGASIGYDISTASEKDAGFWNLTTYGQQFYRYSRMMGAGPIEVRSGEASWPNSVFAWPGPITPPF